MAEFKQVSKAKLVMAIMYSEEKNLEKIKDFLIKKLGEIEFQSEPYDFNFTDYYEDEFGKGLKKLFFVFKNEIDREELVDIRLYTQELEDKFKESNQRMINIDPGYLTKDNLVLASLKEQPYKIYLGKGVFAHMIFMFKKNDVISFKHTFPDYISQKDFFIKVRNEIIKQN